MTLRRSLDPLAFLLLIAAPACIVTPDLVGDTLPAGQESATAADTAAVGTTDGEGEKLQYGAPCELGPPDVWVETSDPPDEDDIAEPQATWLASSDACASGMCLLAYENQLPLNCQADADCGTPDAVCSTSGRCVIAPAYIADHARCTQACETAADCPDIPGCETGTSCGIVRILGGPACCEPVCVCNDQFSAGQAAQFEAQCAGEDFEGCP